MPFSAFATKPNRLSPSTDLTLTDEEFEKIQRQHFAKRTDPAAQQRAAKSLRSCLEAIAAFRDIAGVTPVVRATADDCEIFQTRTLTLPKDWLTKHDLKSKADRYSSNTAIKWSRELQAAFQRANRNAGKKCIRGIVDERRLLTANRPTDAKLVTNEFSPENLGRWFERRLSRWSKSLPKGRASIHVFRKTSLQYARRGEDVNNQVARDARVGTAVMMRHYVKENDPERRNASNRTFYRIAASLAPETAKRYGHLIAQASRDELEKALADAVAARDWSKVSQLSSELGNRAG